ncbi:MAG: hypothetical protein ACYCTV_08785 [Leptospirales bacterium]
MSEVQEKDRKDCGIPLVRDLSGTLQIFPLEGRKEGKRIAIRWTFFLAATGVGIFFLTRLLPIHSVWLVPVSIVSFALFMIVLFVFRLLERPILAVRVTGEGLSLNDFSAASGLFHKKPAVSRYALSDISVETMGNAIPPDGFRMMACHRVLFECHLQQVKDISLYLGIWAYFSMDPECRPPIPPMTSAVSKKKLFWILLSWGLIVLLLFAWDLFENWMASRNYGHLSRP